MKALLFWIVLLLLVSGCNTPTSPDAFGGEYQVHRFYRTDLCDCGPSQYTLVFTDGIVSASGTYSCDGLIVISPFVGTYTFLDSDSLKISNTQQTWLEEATWNIVDHVLIGRWLVPSHTAKYKGILMMWVPELLIEMVLVKQ